MELNEFKKMARRSRKRLNRPLLRAVANRVRTKWRGYDQNAAVSCGSKCCLVGEILLESGLSLKQLQGLCHDWSVNEFTFARNLAGLPLDAKLFDYNGDDWPEEYREQYKEAKTQKGKAHVAASLLEAIADGKVKL